MGASDMYKGSHLIDGEFGHFTFWHLLTSVTILITDILIDGV